MGYKDLDDDIVYCIGFTSPKVVTPTDSKAIADLTTCFFTSQDPDTGIFLASVFKNCVADTFWGRTLFNKFISLTLPGQDDCHPFGEGNDPVRKVVTTHNPDNGILNDTACKDSNNTSGHISCANATDNIVLPRNITNTDDTIAPGSTVDIITKVTRPICISWTLNGYPHNHICFVSHTANSGFYDSSSSQEILLKVALSNCEFIIDPILKRDVKFSLSTTGPNNKCSTKYIEGDVFKRSTANISIAGIVTGKPFHGFCLSIFSDEQLQKSQLRLLLSFNKFRIYSITSRTSNRSLP